jgi:peptidoglycan hydrolase-like protein with peptidoglycan-binding domain
VSTTNTQAITVLRQGSAGLEVIDLQYILQIRGFAPGAIDGDFGPKTRAAVIRFQQSKNLVQDGIVGVQTWTAMSYAWPNNRPGLFLRQGDNGNAVRQLQQGLKSKGFDPGAIDGIFGPKTRAAVIRLQSLGIPRTNIQGVVGPLTWGAAIGN